MTARLLCVVALLWAIVVPALHGHPPVPAAHAGEAVAVVAGAGFAGDGRGGLGEVSADVGGSDHAEAGHTDLPPAQPAAAEMLLVLASATWPRAEQDLAESSRSEVDGARSRGSPVARFEVVRI